MEDYAAKMLPKTDAALREYVTGHVQYREAAVLAALDELRRRGQPAPEEAALRPALEAGAAAQRVADEAAEARRAAERPAPAEPGEVPADAPALYSPLTIILFSIMSVPIGGILLGLNLFRVGQRKALLGLGLYIVAYIAAGLGLLQLAATHGSSVYIWGVLGLNLLSTFVYLQWFWPRYVGGTAYRSRSALVPLAVCLLLVWGVQKFAPVQMPTPGAPTAAPTGPAPR